MSGSSVNERSGELGAVLIRALLALAGLVVIALGGLYLLGSGWLSPHWGPGEISGARISADLAASPPRARYDAGRETGSGDSKQILFGDLHVHTSYSLDAFLMSLPLTGGDGATPVADACDFARFCSGLDFWSINDHALSLTPRRWEETVEAMRQCDAVAGDPADPDVVPFLGWEWTQMGTTASNHYGHKNVILRYLDDARIPARPIGAAPPPDASDLRRRVPSPFLLGLLPLLQWEGGALDLVRFLREMAGPVICPEGVPVRQLPADCLERVATPGALFEKLDDWGHEALVIPHGTTWGFYTPHGSSWDKQLNAATHDEQRQRLVEVFSGHGNSEEYRDWREIEIDADGSRACPEPSASYLPSCWRAGEIILERCLRAGEPRAECQRRAGEARGHYVDADVQGWLTVPGAKLEDWLDAGQCRDCFQPAFNYRPRSSVQYMLALGRPREGEVPARFRFGLIASSDVHSARPGTGYKEYARSVMTEARFGRFSNTNLGRRPARAPEPASEPFDLASSSLPFFAVRESERQASFFLTGGLVAAHAAGRDRDSVWDALMGREVYGTSGPRILLWFDVLNAPGAEPRLPMGSELAMTSVPQFEVRAIGSFEQQPGCPSDPDQPISAERLQRLCRGECYYPSDLRRPITRIEVVRIRPQVDPADPIAPRIEDPWQVLPCPQAPDGCKVRFSDPEFESDGRDAVYYVRAIEAPGLAVNAASLRCERDAAGVCVSVRACTADERTSSDDDCLAPTEERAWSSPIFVDFGGPERSVAGAVSGFRSVDLAADRSAHE